MEKHFIILRFSSIGDIVLTTPVVRCIKKQVPNAVIHFVTKKSYYDVVKANPYISHFYLLENGEHALIENIKQGIKDVDAKNVFIIDLHHNLRTLQIKTAFKKIKSYSFNKLNVQKWLFTKLKINRMPKVHIVDRLLDTVKTFNVHNDGGGLDYFVPTHDEVQQQDIPTALWAGYVGLVIGATYLTKRLPNEKLIELVQKLPYPIMLLGGKEDAENGKLIAQIDPIRIYNACGKFNINESADLVRRAKVVIAHDTGLMHIAAAFKKPVITVWGSTHIDLGMYPYQTKQVQAAVSLGCRPCTKIGNDKCPKGHFKCMQLQDIDFIAHQTQQLWQAP
jgi:ADP-heptose:LPS heptosyltransferase